jgi:hypothetical protein
MAGSEVKSGLSFASKRLLFGLDLVFSATGTNSQIRSHRSDASADFGRERTLASVHRTAHVDGDQTQPGI